MADLIQGIEECDGLDTLVLSGRSFGVKASEAIGRTLSGKSTLKKALWSDMFVSKLKTEIPPALKSLGEGIMTAGAQLVELDLSDNALGPNGILGVMDLLRSPSCFTLKVLKFNNDGLGIGGGKMLSKALLQAHQAAGEAGVQFSPEVFVAGRNRLENEGAAALAEVFATVKTFKEIRMPQNSIFHDGIASLAEALLLNKDLEHLDLSDNIFTERGASCMSETLRQLENLRVVNFEDCLVRSEGAVSIGDALKDGHGRLQVLNLSHNEIKLNAAMTLVNDLQNKDSLESVLLDGNCFGEDGCQQLRDFMESKGKSDILGSLDEDEGSESEDDDGDDSEDDSDNSDRGEREGGDGDHMKEDKDGVAKESSSKSEPAPTEENELGEDCTPQDVARVYVELTAAYTDSMDSKGKRSLENRIDSMLGKMVKEDEFAMTVFLNDLLIRLGLIKGEDKKFVPVTNKEGPLLMLCCLVKKPYFERLHSNIMIAFLRKPSRTLDALHKTRDKLLKTLHSL